MPCITDPPRPHGRWLPLAALGLGIGGLVACATHHLAGEPTPPVAAYAPGVPGFDGARYQGQDPPRRGGLLTTARFFLQHDPGPWVWRDNPPAPPPAASAGPGQLVTTLTGHAGALLQYDRYNVLADPIWSARASPVSFAGPERFVPPGIAFEQLPPLDAVIVSHDHYDHLDLPTLRHLAATRDPLFIVPERQAWLLREAGITRVAELRWGESLVLPPPKADAAARRLRVWGQESRHWTSRRPGVRNESLWQAYVLETTGGPVYFAGDTGYGPHFAATRRAFGPMRLALLPIGAFRPRDAMGPHHENPCEAVQAHHDLAARRSVPIHFGTFPMANDGQDEAPDELRRCAAGEQPLTPEALLDGGRLPAPVSAGAFDVVPFGTPVSG